MSCSDIHHRLSLFSDSLNDRVYPTLNWDELDVWLYSNFRILPGACSSIESVKYQVARLVAEKLLLYTEKFV